jgi:hypothetical protein
MSNASAAQIAANRANSQLSTGPKTEVGKAKSSHNAVKSGLTGRTILIPTDDVAAYETLVQSLIALHRPANYEESILVQSLADTQWRLRRIPSLEAGIYALGRLEAGEALTAQPELIDAQTFLKYKRDLSNLSIQETRLRRAYEKDLARLREMQADRAEKTKPEATASAVALYFEAKRAAAADPSLDISQIGFDFSTSPQNKKEAA